MLQQRKWQQRHNRMAAVLDRAKQPVRIFAAMMVLLGILPTVVLAYSPANQMQDEGQPRPRSILIPQSGPEVISAGEHASAPVSADALLSESEQVKLVVDTDMGVDDATALAAILALHPHRADVQAILTSAGNTEPRQGAANALLLMSQYGLNQDDIPVVIGEEPLEQNLSRTNMLIHGPDGLWWLTQGFPPPNTRGLPDEAEDFYCEELNLSQTKLLVLGPLTNVAEALDECPRKFANADGLEIIILGGAQVGGNKTPVTEYNFWQDPEAARAVFEFAEPQEDGEPNRISLTLIPLDTFAQVLYPYDYLYGLAAEEGTIGQFLTLPFGPSAPPGPLFYYFSAQTGGDENLPALIPDVVAAAYALAPSVGTTRPAIVEVIAGEEIPELVQGQSVIALSSDGYPPGTRAQFSMVVDDSQQSRAAVAGFANTEPYDPAYIEPILALSLPILLNPPTNAQVVTQVESQQIRDVLFHLLARPLEAAEAQLPDLEDVSGDLYLPLVATSN